MRVFINNRDRLTSTRAMVEYLSRAPGAEVTIIDNASTYPPLLEWYDGCGVEVVRLRENLGPRALWRSTGLVPASEDYAATDSDLDLSLLPLDLLEALRAGLALYPKIVKAGLSLEIDDLPAGTPLTLRIREWESRWWRRRLNDFWWDADTDTTFAVYRAGTTEWPGVLPAARADRPYTARHLPWYGMTDEDEYYFDHCNPEWASWAGEITGRRSWLTMY